MKLGLLSIGLFLALTHCAQGTETKHLTQVLIIGDSISVGYTAPLQEILKDTAIVTHNPGNAQHSAFGLENLDSWLGDTKWDVIHFNHGLHDLKYVDSNGKSSRTKENAHVQIPLDEYRENMEGIVARLKKTGAALIFATTTPFPESVNPFRIPADVEKYNAVALEVMKNHGVAVNDLCTFVLPQLTSLQRPKNVHFTEEGSKALAQEVAKHILRAIGQEGAPADD